MNTKLTGIGKLIILPFILMVVLTGTYGQAKKTSGGEVTFAYNFPAGEAFSYVVNTTARQQMEVEGQIMDILARNNLVFKVALQERRGENLVIGITIDTLSASVDAMGNTIGGVISEVAGKTFNLVLTRGGKIVDNSEGEKITYSIDGQNTGNLGQTLRNVFPTLPAKPVKPGETWTSKDTVKTQSAGANVFQIIESTNTYEKNENVNGIMCAKVVSSVKGTNQTTTQNMGMDILMHGPVTGQSIIYFALDGGYPVRVEEVSKMNGTIEISSPQSMSFPIVMEVNTTIQLR
ncbi:MAG: hypothetical protein WBJ37_05140 [Bacteroidales bacterium]